MADHVEITKSLVAIKKQSSSSQSLNFPVLVPNIKGLEAAITAGAEEIAIFGTPSEAFCKRNANCDVEESIKRFREVTKVALNAGLRVRGYVSCVIGKPMLS